MTDRYTVKDERIEFALPSGPVRVPDLAQLALDEVEQLPASDRDEAKLLPGLTAHRPDLGEWVPALVAWENTTRRGFVFAGEKYGSSYLVAEFAAPPLTDPNARVQQAIQIALEYGQFEGDHHRAYAIDQMLRALTGDGYDETILRYCAGEDGPDTYTWDVGIAP